MEALVNDLREHKDTWMKKYHDLLGAYEKLQAEMRDLKVDKENLNRKLDRQNTEILRLTNEHKVSGQSSVKLKDVARFKTKNRGAGL
jgi:predicted nuclease with TOPRIM domain